MDIRFVKPFGSNAPGKVVQGFHSGAAAELIRRGVAEAAEPVSGGTVNRGQWRRDEAHGQQKGRKHK